MEGQRNFTLFRRQYMVCSRKHPCILVVLHAHFIMISGTSVGSTRYVLEYSARSLNSVGQGEEFCFPESNCLCKL